MEQKHETCSNYRHWYCLLYWHRCDSVTQSLREAKSGIVAAPDYKELGFRSQVKGAVDIDLTAHIDRKQMRFMGEGAAYAVVAMQQAVIDSGLTAAEISNPEPA